MTSSGKNPKNWSEWNKIMYFSDYSKDLGTGKFVRLKIDGCSSCILFSFFTWPKYIWEIQPEGIDFILFVDIFTGLQA